MAESKFMTVKEAARELDVNPETIRRLVSKGLLPALVFEYPTRKTIKIKRKEFKDYLETSCSIRPDRIVAETRGTFSHNKTK